MMELFLIGTWAFWSLVIGASLFLLWALERENGWQAFLTLAITLTFVSFANDINLIHWLSVNLETIAIGVAGYFIVGTVWGIVKWYLFVTGQREKLDEALAEMTIEEARRRGVPVTAPQASRHKARILLWMTYWPWSATWTLINDPVRRAFRYAYARIAGLLQGISDRAYRDVPRIP